MDIDHYQSKAEEELSRYEIKNPHEIEQIIRGLANDRVLVSAQGLRSKECFLSTILGVNEQKGLAYMECIEDSPVNDELLGGTGANFSATYKGVRIQFTVPKAERVQFDSLEAYRIKLPASLFRFQRREYYRVEVSQVKPTQCIIPMGGRELITKVANISLGGLGIRYGMDESPLEVGMAFENVRLITPEGDTYSLTLKIRNSTILTLKNDIQVRHVGGQFINLPKKTERDIQMYLFKLEKEQRLGEK